MTLNQIHNWLETLVRKLWATLLGREFKNWVLLLRQPDGSAVVAAEMQGTRQEAEDSAPSAIVHYWWSKGDLTKQLMHAEYVIVPTDVFDREQEKEREQELHGAGRSGPEGDVGDRSEPAGPG